MADIFISYKREDRRVAERLSLALEQLGFEVWWDFELLSGDRYRKVIREVIDQCPVAIVLWSARSSESDFVLDEATHAKELNKLCPARIDDTPLPYGFGQAHTDDLRGWEGAPQHEGFQGLVRAVEARLGRKGALGQRRGGDDASEIDAFSAAQLAGSAEALRAFLRAHPNGRFARFVRTQLEDMPAAPVVTRAPRPTSAPIVEEPKEEDSAPPIALRTLGALVLIALLVGGVTALGTLLRREEEPRGVKVYTEGRTYAPYDIAQLAPEIRGAVETARATAAEAEQAAQEARNAAARAEGAARRAQNSEPGTYTIREDRSEWFGEVLGTYFGEATTEWVDSFGMNVYGVVTVTARGDASYPDLRGDRLSGRFASREGQYSNRLSPGVYQYAKNATNRDGLAAYAGHFGGSWPYLTHNGLGVLRWRNGTVFQGRFRANALVSGVLVQADGTRYEGEFSGTEGLERRVMWNRNGAVSIAGAWEDNEFRGPSAR